MYVAMQVWLLMLNCNRGLHFTYILNAIPTKHLYTCGDAALMGVVGGTQSTSTSQFPLASYPTPGPLRRVRDLSQVAITLLELFAAFIAVNFFATPFRRRYLI